MKIHVKDHGYCPIIEFTDDGYIVKLPDGTTLTVSAKDEQEDNG